ncbi:type I pantothenate kinase [Candidatus Curculioniphilus buchneri]|uniref:type I pantothenate kinase n=1 Tax=Candidatus Curculioniphilus buchneri TaxID=690594 RepID=UPI00376F09B4
MINAINIPLTKYLQFNRTQWTMLKCAMPMPLTLTAEEIIKIKMINEDFSFEEISEIYLPLSRLLNFYINSNLYRQTMLNQCFDTASQRIPYIIGIAGSVAVGKSTTARILQTILSRWPEHRTVELVTTDSFLHSNNVLKKQDLMQKKGFPESYDFCSLVNFISKMKSGASNVTIPVYSHLNYDILPERHKVISQPDILILEGLNVLQIGRDCKSDINHIVICNYSDFSIYLDASEDLLQDWYIMRFLKCCRNAFHDSNSYFHNYSQLCEQKIKVIAQQLWKKINGRNLHKNILPTRERASLILSKTTSHVVNTVWLRKQFIIS